MSRGGSSRRVSRFDSSSIPVALAPISRSTDIDTSSIHVLLSITPCLIRRECVSQFSVSLTPLDNSPSLTPLDNSPSSTPLDNSLTPLDNSWYFLRALRVQLDSPRNTLFVRCYSCFGTGTSYYSCSATTEKRQ
eukprot:gene2424-biopygen11458